jgi:nicotinamidase-related amidase
MGLPKQLPANTALILIDIQQGMDDPRLGARNNPGAEANCAALLAAWRKSRRPIIHVQHASKEAHSPFHPSDPGHRLKDAVRPLPSEVLFVKQENSAFIGTELEAHLRSHGIGTLVLCGLTAQHCVSTTVRMAGNLGFTCYLPGDATAGYAAKDHRGKVFDPETIHAVTLATLHDEFATVVDTKDVLAAV